MYRLKRHKRRAQDNATGGGAAAGSDDVAYPKVIVTEVLQPTHALKELAKQTSFAGVPFFEINGCKNMIQDYISKSRLDKENDDDGAPTLKGGQIRLDPILYAILHPKPQATIDTIRKDAIFKSIPNCTNPAFVISPVDPNQNLQAQEAQTFTLIKQ